MRKVYFPLSSQKMKIIMKKPVQADFKRSYSHFQRTFQPKQCRFEGLSVENR